MRSLNNQSFKSLKSFLIDHYVLEEEYFIEFGDNLMHVETAFEELVRIYCFFPCKIIWNHKPDEEMTAKELFRHLIGRLGKNSEVDKNIHEFIKGEPYGSKPEYNIHQWHLARFYPNTAGEIFQDIKSIYLKIKSFDSFDAIFDEIASAKGVEDAAAKTQNQQSRFKGFGATCIYDTVFRMAFSLSKGDDNYFLLPKEYVYIHSKPGETAQAIMKNGDMKSAKNRIAYSDIIDSSYMTGKNFAKYEMLPMDIENFLCLMHDAILILYNEDIKNKKRKSGKG